MVDVVDTDVLPEGVHDRRKAASGGRLLSYISTTRRGAGWVFNLFRSGYTHNHIQNHPPVT